MTRALPQSPLANVDDLLRRYNGPVPAADLLAALAGEPVGLLRERSISREIDRAALSALRSIASHRQGLPGSTCLDRDCLALDELTLSLARYRALGLSLAGSNPSRNAP